MDKLAPDPHAGRRIEEVAAFDEALCDRTAPDLLVQTGELIFCGFYLRISILRMSYPRWLWVVLRD
ncbi:hypothetical protein [Mesorhizobium sp. M1204]|uniref:hypothetical protein n=1 Tax=Mesorhizobium sp. M1204 TaxID=2957068 RepID=UPI00333CC00B